MELPIPAEADGLLILRSQIRECFGRVVYSHKTHEKAADDRLRKLSRIKLAQIALSAITTAGFIVTVFGDPSTSRISAIVSAVFSVFLLALNTYTKDVDPGQSAQRHKETAGKLWDVRESYLSLLTDIASSALTGEAIRARRDELQASLAQIYAGGPRTTDRAYAAASEGLQEREEATFTDDEIDKFLPAPLRLKQEQ